MLVLFVLGWASGSRAKAKCSHEATDNFRWSKIFTEISGGVEEDCACSHCTWYVNEPVEDKRCKRHAIKHVIFGSLLDGRATGRIYSETSNVSRWCWVQYK